ncbi:DUF1566 domain-containing protein [Shewanella sp.]|nr:DUF1566 domain-containing protein [Shewanella sp.]
MNKYFKGLFALIVLPLLTLLAGCNSDDAFTALTSIEITASPVSTKGASQLTLAAGNTQKFTALGHYSDGTSKPLTGLSVADWRTSDKNMGVFSAPGVFTGGDTAGVVSVNVVKDGVSSNALKVNVTSAVITGVSVSSSSGVDQIAKGEVTRLVAMATYSDNTVVEVSDSVAWELSNPSVADIDATGALTGKVEGSTEIRATKEGFSSDPINITVTAAFITKITLTAPKDMIAKGQGLTLVATAIYNDKTTSDITDSVTWQVGNTKAVTTISNGMLAGKEAGVVKIKAAKDNVISDEFTLTVTNAVITSITLSGDKYSLAHGQRVPLTAMAIYSDNTSADITKEVTWTYSDNTIVTIQPDGMLIGEKPGKVDISASKDNAISNVQTFTVTTAVIASVTLTAEQYTVANGESVKLTATAIYSNNTSSNVSQTAAWTFSKQDIASVKNDTNSSDAIFTGKKLGEVDVKAFINGVDSNGIKITVTSAVLKSLTLSARDNRVAVGQTEVLTIKGAYSDNSVRILNSNLINNLIIGFSSNNRGQVTVDKNGVLKGKSEGDVIVKAAVGGIQSNPLGITVTAAVIDSVKLDIAGNVTSVAKGQEPELIVTATYSDKSSGLVRETDIIWKMDTDGLAQVNKGKLQVNSAGTLEIRALVDGGGSNFIASNKITITTTNAVIDTLEITPSNPLTLIVDATEQFGVKATYTDGQTAVNPLNVVWKSSNASVSVDRSGRVEGLTSGTSTIVAASDNNVQSAGVLVTVCNLAQACIDLFNISSTQILTSPPSKAYLESIQLGRLAAGDFTETGASGPAGQFSTFIWDNANQLCAEYNKNGLGGRTNWKLPTQAVLQLPGENNPPVKKLWPVGRTYWASTKFGTQAFAYNFLAEKVVISDKNANFYVSCVSDK